MKKRDFNEWFSSFTDTIATWKYYTNFDKVYKNVNQIKDELNLLNGLIGEENIREEFMRITSKYPNVLKVVPILIAKREKEIIINDAEQKYNFNFQKTNYTIEEYAMFMEKTGLFDLLQNHMIHSLVDYVTGVEVGMDTNGRKSRTGDAMEDLVESFICKAGFIKNKTYFKEMERSKICELWGVDLSAMTNTGKTEKKFDFVIKTDSMIYGIETNFYNAQGSKPNETAGNYKLISTEVKNIKGFKFLWFTDGKGWKPSRNNLEEVFNVLEHLYNIKDLENGILEEVIK